MITKPFFMTFLCGLCFLQTATASGFFDVPENQNSTYVDIGAAAVHRPTYLGSGENVTNIFPYINAEYKGRFYAKPQSGIGIYPINNNKVRLGVGLNAAFGRDADDVPLLGETGEISTVSALHVSARYLFKLAAIDLTTDIPIGGDVGGFRTSATFGTRFPVSDNITLSPGVRATYTSADWTDAFYGISAEQSAASGLAEFDVGDTISSVGLVGLIFYDVTDTIQLVGTASYNHLIGDTQDSPLVFENDGLTLVVGVARTF